MQQPKVLNQRASHFTLGNTGDSLGSIYKIDYIKKEGNQDRNPNFIDPFKGQSINPPNKSSFSTTNNALLKDWGQIDKAALDPNKLKQLRGHHFNLGCYNPDDLYTTNKYYHNQKEITSDALKNREQSKNKMRAHFHDFKEQPYTNFKSTYNNEFLGKDGQPANRVAPDNTKNAIVFGNHQLPKITTNTADYVKKTPTSNEIKNSLQQSSSLVLGDKSEDMKTMNQVYFDEKQITKNELPQATIKELRNTHFNLGAGPNMYATENNQHYNVPRSSKVQTIMPDYQSGSWMPQNSTFNSSTTNKRQLPARDGEPYSKKQPKVKGGFRLGDQGNSYTTQFKNQFDPKEPNYKRAVKGPVKDNVEIGDDKGRYLTEQKQSYIDRDLNAARCKVDIAAKSKQDHFQIGGQGQDPKLTVYQDQFREDLQKRSKLFHKQNV